jgi:Ca2+-transporting ATPase
MLRIGIVLATVTIAVMAWAYGYCQDHTEGGLSPNRWKTIVFTTLCIAQMGHALAIRSNTKLVAQVNLWSNPALLLSVTITTLLQFLLIYVEPCRNFFGTYYLPFAELMVCIGASAVVFVWIEAEKLFLKRWVKGNRN